MAQEVTLGGDRLGSGQKQTVELHNYGMTSFNLEQDFKSSMAAGVLYPFLKMVGTNHGTFDIDLDTLVRTIPTRGPLFGSFKLQADIFCVPFRLYQGILHNNPVSLGLNMDKVKLPKMIMKIIDGEDKPMVKGANEYNYQVNESSLMKYLGLSGIGKSAQQQDTSTIYRKINAIPMLAYYDIFKTYYANKQEENAYVITPGEVQGNNIELEKWYCRSGAWPDTPLGYWNVYKSGTEDYLFEIYTKDAIEITEQIKLNVYFGISTEEESQTINDWENAGYLSYEKVNENQIIVTISNEQMQSIFTDYGSESDTSLELSFEADQGELKPSYSADIKLQPFALANIDDMRNFLLSNNTLNTQAAIQEGSTTPAVYIWNETRGTDQTGLPYVACVKNTTEGLPYNAFAMNGLVVKTYQSDLFNNWLNSEYIDGENGISAISSVAVVNSAFTMDSLNMAEKIYEYLNRVLVAGGTYEDWQEATYGQGAVRKAETPMYVGGMAAEVGFEEVISTSETKIDGDKQALGSLGGRGANYKERGGKNIHIKCDEPCYIIGIVSLTPRICYSQGNDWDLTELDTIDDLHKPALDGIGFQDLIVEQMAWWNTVITPNSSTIVHRDSAGKQTAWINYQTAVDKCYGDFAKSDGYAFMVLNRNYEIGDTAVAVKDITTYIDPSKFNYAFAYTELDAQNFWVQIHSKIIARRKMGAQQIPNL